MKNWELAVIAPSCDLSPTSRAVGPVRDRLAAVLARCRWRSPDGNGQIIAGHGRAEAAKLIGRATVPAIRLSHMSGAEIRTYVLADNRLAEKAGWDREILAIELQELIDLDFDVELTGFEAPYVDVVLDAAEANGEPPAPEDEIPDPPPAGAAVSRSGDVWTLGSHRLLCGSSLDSASYQILMAGELAEMVFTDPPYNVRIDGNVSGLGRVHHCEFAMASGEMSESDFAKFLQTTFEHLAAACMDVAIHFVCMDWRHIGEILGAGRAVYSELKNVAVWNKTNGGMGTFYRSKHELIFVWKVGTAPHVNNFELGQHGRHRTNVWDYAGVNTNSILRTDVHHLSKVAVGETRRLIITIPPRHLKSRSARRWRCRPTFLGTTSPAGSSDHLRQLFAGACRQARQ